MSVFKIQKAKHVDDGIGGLIEDWQPFKTVEGYLDLITGTDLNTVQNSFTEQSTHMLIIPIYTEGITDDMRVVGKDNRYYTITYSDNPVGADHHNEVYCKYAGVLNE